MTTRTLSVGSKTLILDPDAVEALSKYDIIYPCGDEHDLHLNPEKKFHLGEVELILGAIIGVV